MRREDIMVEVRDRDLVRRGQITTRFLRLKASIRHNAPGSWQLTLPGAHPMVPYLSAPGAGIVVSSRVEGEPWSTLFSGPTVKPTRARSLENPDGTFTFEGVTDEQLAADARAYPEPSNADVSTQAQANDTRVGRAETMMRHYVQANIGVSAPAGRVEGFREFIRQSQPDSERGPIVTKSPRFQIIAEVLSEIATLAGLGWRFVQRGDFIEFEVVDVVDRSGFVRFDIANGTLTSEQVEVTPPSLTRAIVAGQGEGAARTIIQRTTADSVLAELDWGRVIERFIDQRNTDELVELQQSGDEALIEEGFVATNVKVVPADETTMLFGRDWAVGDIVGVVVAGQETKTTVTEAVILVDNERCVVGAAIGDVRDFDPKDALTKRVDDTERRVEQIERTAESTGKTEIEQMIADAVAAVRVPAGAMTATAAAAAPTGWLLCDGSLVSRATYADLFAAIGTTYGAGDGSTTFALPNGKGRVIVGRDAAVGAFDTLGETGGEIEHQLTIPEMPMHQHQQTFSTHAIAAGGGSTIGGMTNSGGNQSGAAQQHTNYSGGITGTTDPGESIPHNNLQPYIVANLIIKT